MGAMITLSRRRRFRILKEPALSLEELSRQSGRYFALRLSAAGS